MIEKKLYDTTKPQEKAILVAVAPKQQAERLTQDYLDELDFLSTTAKAEVVKRFVQKLERPDHSTYVGKGKLEEIVAWIEENPIDLVIFDDDLSPAQVRNLEAELKVKILDRSLLILYIFSMRAQTAQAKTQVELAQYQYMLPRLTRLWSHLSKQRGGIGNRGPGEKELETDRRIVNDRISFLKEKLKEIDKQSVTRRKNREKIVRVALVGYTNVGKSTLMNLLSKSDVFAENKLFATVDATVRKIVWGNIPFLLTDTVGFIRKLPTHLIESFKSTLDEIREADVLVHVVDVAHPAHENHIEVVNQILADLKCSEKPTILVFNKIDMVPASENHLEEKSSHNSVFISAEKKLNINRLREELLVEISKAHIQIFPNWLADEVYSGI
jgi:GTP-binding protein HflX